MTTEKLSEKRDWVKEIIEVMTNWQKKMLDLAKIYADAIEEDPANREILKEAVKGLPPKWFQQVEAGHYDKLLETYFEYLDEQLSGCEESQEPSSAD